MISAFPFGWAIRLRHELYDRGVVAIRKAPLPVVSIGNIVAGGVGKTQVALLLAQELGAADVAILSRGYKGRAARAKRPLLVDVKKHRAEVSGDEPWLLASRLPSSRVIVHPDRLSGACEAQRLGAKLAILDDGMQHRRLHRDCEIVVVDGSDPFAGHAFLPWGRLREWPDRLKNADLIVVMGELSEENEKALASRSSAPRVVMHIEGQTAVSLKNERVGLFCAIGNPQRFVRSVEQLGGDLVTTLFLPDHRPIGLKRLQQFALRAQAAGAKRLVCTEKDEVKLEAGWMEKLPLPLEVVRAELKIVANRQAWEQQVTQLKELIR